MEPGSVLGAVEVKKAADSDTWYCGQIVEVVRDSVVVAFDGDVWKRQKFPLASVRKPPALSLAELEKFSPQKGEQVELRELATEQSPSAWTTATVKKIQGAAPADEESKSGKFYFVSCAKAAAGEPYVIVEKDKLRPPSAGTGLSSTTIEQATFDIVPELHDWMNTADASGCFSHIETQSGLLCIQKLEHKLHLLGEARCIRLARNLLEVHVKHQGEIQRFQDQRDKRLKALEQKRSRIQGSGYKNSVEVKVSNSYIKRIIGKGGEVIKAMEEKYGVSVRILDDDGARSEETMRTVRIFGNCPETLEKAKAEVEFVEESLVIDPEQFAWTLGKKGSTIQAVRDSCNLVYASLYRENSSLRFCGTRQAVQDALAMFETHLMYYPVIKQMDDEMDSIICQLEDYGDWNARWQWSQFRDLDPDDSHGGGGWSGHGGWNSWKDWNEEKGNSWWHRQEYWEEPEPARRKGKGNSSKGGKGGGEYWQEEPKPAIGKGKGNNSKGGKGGGEYWQEEPEPAIGKGKGNDSKGGKGGGGWSYQPKEKKEKATAPSKDSRKEADASMAAVVGRRMGKNGPRI